MPAGPRSSKLWQMAKAASTRHSVSVNRDLLYYAVRYDILPAARL